MAGEPKRRHSTTRKRVRRASIKLESLNLIKCPSCGEPALPHQVCKSCGFYEGKQIKTKTEVKVTKA
jgi:large subunit ribosomal protein L32